MGSRLRASRRRASSASTQEREIDRATALERIRGRHVSTFDLLDADEVAAGTARAERELPERVPVRLEWAIVVAEV